MHSDDSLCFTDSKPCSEFGMHDERKFLCVDNLHSFNNFSSKIKMKNTVRNNQSDLAGRLMLSLSRRFNRKK